MQEAHRTDPNWGEAGWSYTPINEMRCESACGGRGMEHRFQTGVVRDAHVLDQLIESLRRGSAHFQVRTVPAVNAYAILGSSSSIGSAGLRELHFLVNQPTASIARVRAPRRNTSQRLVSEYWRVSAVLT